MASWPQSDTDLAAPPGTPTLDASGHLVVPGLVNAHFHSPGNLLKGTLPGYPLEIFMLCEVPPLAPATPDPRMADVSTMLGAMEMLKSGVTSVMDDAFHVPIATEASVDAICRAYADSGMRARVAIDQPNVVEYAKFPISRICCLRRRRRAWMPRRASPPKSCSNSTAT